MSGFDSRQHLKLIALCSFLYRLRDPLNLLFHDYRGSFPGVNWTERESDHISPPSADVMNVWMYTSTSPICFDDLDKDMFTFLDT